MARPTVTLHYTPPGGVATSKTYAVLSLRGLYNPDEVTLFPGIQHTYLNGAVQEQIKGTRREITIDIGVIQDRADQLAILYFLLDPARYIDYWIGTGTNPTESGVDVALADAGGFSTAWEADSELGRRFTLRLRENTIITGAWPV